MKNYVKEYDFQIVADYSWQMVPS